MTMAAHTVSGSASGPLSLRLRWERVRAPLSFLLTRNEVEITLTPALCQGERGQMTLLQIVLLGALCAALSGCANMRAMTWRRDPLAPKSCTLPQNPTVAEIVAHVNANVDKIQAWKCDSVRINAAGVPVPLDGHLYVEREHRLRLEVASVMGPEVDFGSNDELFWIWSRRAERPEVLYAAHADLDLAQQRFPVPFEPKWLMEALSIAPLSAEGARLESAPGSAEVRLVSDHTLPNGQPVRKIVLVDGCHGKVLEHSTYDANNRPLVRVRLGDHRYDAASGALLPRYVKLDWPMQKMSMEMVMNGVQVNPASLPPQVWSMKQVPGTQAVNLGRAPGERKPTQVAAATTGPRSRAGLVAPETVPAFSTTVPNGDRDFELPQVTQPARGVHPMEPDFEPPLDSSPGRARFNASPELFEVAPQ